MNKPVAWLIQTKTAHQFTFKEPTTIPIDAVVEPLYTHPVKEKLSGYAEGFGAGKMYAELEFKEQIENLETALKTALLILRKAQEK